MSHVHGASSGLFRPGSFSWLRGLVIRSCQSLEYPGTPPQELSCSEVILDDLDYMTGSFNSFVMEDAYYFTWIL